MRPRWLTIPAASISVALTACVNNGGLTSSNNPTGTGPFDSRGNYVEAWADNPSQWRKGSSTVVEAAPDRPAANVPVTPPVIVSNTTPNPGSGTSTTVIHRKPTPRPTAVASNTTKPKAVVKKAPVKKVVVKAKPKSTRHTVRSGENLYNIAKRYGTSVGAVQKANGIKGSVIRPGQSLVIPR